MRVLIVDDAAFMRMMLRKILETAGYEVAGEAVDGNDAVAKYFELKPDLVTMDITMPAKDGIEAVGEIRAKDPKAKILMTSAMGQEPMVRAAILAGAYDFVVKPVEEERFLKAVSRAAK
ncbi:response regulator [Cohnella sp. CFH 77786]|uniref:response regulator n=1 Tax=Cohnella sp. CFH 77786 TaxID=2662265 RepID=UPI001C60B0A8|nr:response regulator [Cohnella sp. CFH 77786]MBW5449308.1 response regulator [Cohnella sp. CFH 77786]